MATFKPSGKIRVLGHRGFSARYPENTAMAFREALAQGADGVECDIQKTEDGHFVVVHDVTTDRTARSAGRVSSLTLEQLRKFDFGNGEKILELTQLFELVPADRFLNIELKGETIRESDCSELVKIILSARGIRETMISSFVHSLLPAFRKAGFITGMLLGEEHSKLGAAVLVLRVLSIRPVFLNLPFDGFERLGSRRYILLIRLFRLLGCQIAFWTVDRPDQWQQIAPFTEIFITNEVVAARRWVEERQ